MGGLFNKVFGKGYFFASGTFFGIDETEKKDVGIVYEPSLDERRDLSLYGRKPLDVENCFDFYKSFGRVIKSGHAEEKDYGKPKNIKHIQTGGIRCITGTLEGIKYFWLRGLIDYIRTIGNKEIGIQSSIKENLGDFVVEFTPECFPHFFKEVENNRIGGNERGGLYVWRERYVNLNLPAEYVHYPRDVNDRLINHDWEKYVPVVEKLYEELIEFRKMRDD